MAGKVAFPRCTILSLTSTMTPQSKGSRCSVPLPWKLTRIFLARRFSLIEAPVIVEVIDIGGLFLPSLDKVFIGILAKEGDNAFLISTEVFIKPRKDFRDLYLFCRKLVASLVVDPHSRCGIHLSIEFGSFESFAIELRQEIEAQFTAA